MGNRSAGHRPWDDLGVDLPALGGHLSDNLRPFVSTLLEVLDGEVGVTEEPGNTGVPFMRYALGGEVPAAWCARFVRWAFEKAGRPLPGNRWKNGSVNEMMVACTQAGWGVTGPKPGAIVFFKTRGDSDRGPGRHVGVVTSVSGDMFQTIEGNAGGGVKVARNSYRLDNPRIIGFAAALDSSAS